ncbi:hypothetical protein [Flavitalea sp.]|nr:hypothetical protein [Flavitalea sp.]
MKNIFVIALCLSCFATKIVGQRIAYYDAIYLKFLADSNQGKFKISAVNRNIFNYYFGPNHNDSELTALIKANPFLKAYFEGPGIQSIPKGFSVPSLAQSIGGLDVTNIADGLAKFLIKRGKEELNIAFFQRMKDFLKKNDEAKTLFPSTAAFLDKIESYRYSELLHSLREVFYKDISNLIINLNLLIDLPKYQKLLKALPEIRVAIRSAKIISELSQSESTSTHPANLISRFAELKEWGEMNINLQSSWEVLNRISESVREKAPEIYDTTVIKISRVVSTISPGDFITDTVKLTAGYYSIKRVNVGSDTALKFETIDSLIIKSRTDKLATKKKAWIKFSDFHDNILGDTITLQIFLGLLYQRMDSVTFRNAKGQYTSVQDFMRENKDDILKIADLVENFLVLANDVEQSIKEIREKKGSLTNDDYYRYIQKAIDVTEYGFKVANVIKPGIADDRYISMAKNANDLYKNIYTKSYNAAVMNAYLILEEVLVKTDQARKDKKKFYDSLRVDSLFIKYTSTQTTKIIDSTAFRANDSNLTNTKLLEQDSLEDRSTTVERILRYGNMIASIVKSETSEEAEAAIEAAVLPAGSSSIKKNSCFNISLNAYIGGYINNNANNTDKIDGNNSTVGVTSPIGIAFSWGLGHYRNGNNIGSLSIYGTLIDVGAIVGYRLSNDSTALEQKITIDDIFTPGGYLVYGLGLPFRGLSYIPLSVGYGFQYGSKLYQKKDDGKLAESEHSRWRSNWFVAIDIPLVNFWTKNYRKKK